MLVGVVQEDGTGHQAAIPGYTVAGKTGTTKKIDADGTYSDSRYVAWFVGFAPAQTPARRDAGHGRRAAGRRYYGGEVAAPAFAELTSRALLALGVQRDRSHRPAADAARGRDADAVGRRYAAWRRKTSAALWPPKPKLFESTASTRAGAGRAGDVVETAARRPGRRG